MTEAERAYAAGLFDGEGYVGILLNRGKYHQLRVSIGNTDPRMIEWLYVRTGAGCITSKPRQSLSHKRCFDWVVMDEQAEQFLTAIYPYVVIKRDRVDVALAFRRLVLPARVGATRRLTPSDFEAREGARAQLKALNRKGV